MKVKTSLMLSKDVVEGIDRLASITRDRSDVIDFALRAYLAQIDDDARGLCDLEIINRNADELNREAEDILAFQGE